MKKGTQQGNIKAHSQSLVSLSLLLKVKLCKGPHDLNKTEFLGFSICQQRSEKEDDRCLYL